MIKVPQQLHEVAQQVHQDGKARLVRVRDLLEWFEAQRRGMLVVRQVRAALRKVKLVTVPDFEVAYIDQRVKLKPLPPGTKTTSVAKGNAVEVADTIVDSIDAIMIGGNIRDSAAQIGTLAAANTLPEPVTRDTDVLVAITRMHYEGYSHLPVMQNDRHPEGVISWRSIGKARISAGKPCRFVRECMERAEPIRWDMHLFDAIKIIAEKEAVLVKNPEGRVSGLVTTTDISLQFGALSEPFLLLREIENYIRRLIDGKFTLEQLKATRDQSYPSRKIETVDDLSFGEYVRLLEKPANWDKLGFDLERNECIKRLRETGRIRNDVMHFHPDPITEGDMKVLRDTRKFLQVL